MAVLKGIAYWACANHLNTTHVNCWCIDLALDKESLKAAKEMGLTIATREYKNLGKVKNVVKIKRDEVASDGSTNPKPVVLIEQGGGNVPFTGMIGNGSEVSVQMRPWTWEYKGKSGTSADFKAILVHELVAYGEPDGSAFGYDSTRSADEGNTDGDAFLDDDIPF